MRILSSFWGLGLIGLLLSQSGALAQTAAPAKEAPRAFTVTIDGFAVPIDPGETVEVKLSDGKTVSVSLTQNPFARWADSLLSFEHPTGLAVGTQEISKKLTQHLIATAVGSVIIVQEYESIDPTLLKQLMLNELTKDDVKVGATLTQSETSKTLSSGIKLLGLRGVLKSRAKVKTVEIFTYAKDDHGVLLVNAIEDDRSATDQPFIDKFWETLEFKF
jgi:hypothetical protein